MRTELSALRDGEAARIPPAQFRAHLAACADCAAFGRSLDLIAELLVADRADPLPDLVAGVMAARRVGSRPLLALRAAIVACALAELVTAVAFAWFSTPSEGHQGHESLAFSVALSVGLVCAAIRPELAIGYLPILGATTLLLVLTSALDIRAGEASLIHESSHLGLEVGFVLLVILATTKRAGGSRFVRVRRPVARAAKVRGLSVVRRVATRRWASGAAALTLLGGLVVAGPAASAAPTSPSSSCGPAHRVPPGTL